MLDVSIYAKPLLCFFTAPPSSFSFCQLHSYLLIFKLDPLLNLVLAVSVVVVYGHYGSALDCFAATVYLCRFLIDWLAAERTH